MSSTAIRVENLSKIYRIGMKEEMSDTLVGSIRKFVSQPFANFKRLQNLTHFKDAENGADDILWALRDIDIDVSSGEAIGIIGHNGAGKSTLLKILSRITEPSRGRAIIRGRVSSLLEVGTGFHPELTGRENIYLNGTILGMTKKEVDSKLEEIIEFAEIGKFIDTPVKRYSSGMGVRLAFAVAAHLEPEILLIDEVLAVGDVAFQKKCLGKMGEVTSGGRTVLFVSHNMGAVSRLCTRGIVLDHGRVKIDGSVEEAIDQYMNIAVQGEAERVYPVDETLEAQFLRSSITDENGNVTAQIDRMKPVRFTLEYCIRKPMNKIMVMTMLDRADGTLVMGSIDTDTDPGKLEEERKPGTYMATIELPEGLLNAGFYQFRPVIYSQARRKVYHKVDPCSFHLVDSGTFAAVGGDGKQRKGVLALELPWSITRIGD